jgi:hypothetical protein
VDVSDDDLLAAADSLFADYDREEELPSTLQSRLPDPELFVTMRDGKIIDEPGDDE